MDRGTLKRALWTARNELGRLGTWGVFGIGLLAFAAGLRFTVLEPMGGEIASLQEEASALRERLSAADISAAERPLTHDEKLKQFYGFFPPPATARELLGRIFSAAQARRLVLKAGEYRMQEEPGFRLARYQVLFPVAGNYRDVRGFADDVLKTVPTAALDEIAFKRDSVGSTTVEARIRITMYLRGE